MALPDEVLEAMQSALVAHLRAEAEREGWFYSGWLEEKGEISLDIRDLHVPSVIDALFTALQKTGYAVVPRVATEGMAEAFAFKAWHDNWRKGRALEDTVAADAWTAMLNAAENLIRPSPPGEA